MVNLDSNQATREHVVAMFVHEVVADRTAATVRTDDLVVVLEDFGLVHLGDMIWMGYRSWLY